MKALPNMASAEFVSVCSALMCAVHLSRTLPNCEALDVSRNNVTIKYFRVIYNDMGYHIGNAQYTIRIPLQNVSEWRLTLDTSNTSTVRYWVDRQQWKDSEEAEIQEIVKEYV